LTTEVAVYYALLFGGDNIFMAHSETGQIPSALSATNRQHQVARQSFKPVILAKCRLPGIEAMLLETNCGGQDM